MKYRDMTLEQKEAKKARSRKYCADDREEYIQGIRKYCAEHLEEHIQRIRKYYAEHEEERIQRIRKYKEERIQHIRKYKANDVNSTGVTKTKIRTKSRYRLFKTHAKLLGYEIHHCFGYDDPSKFIYIPRKLHLQIHQLLRDKNVSAESNHWNTIRDHVTGCEEYTYVRA
jgi:hypothetical protein